MKEITFFWVFSNVYRLQYRRGSTTNEEIKGLNKFKTCALTDFGVNYTQEDGQRMQQIHNQCV